MFAKFLKYSRKLVVKEIAVAHRDHVGACPGHSELFHSGWISGGRRWSLGARHCGRRRRATVAGRADVRTWRRCVDDRRLPIVFFEMLFWWGGV